MKHLSLTIQGLSPQALLSGRYTGGVRLTGPKQHTAKVTLCCQERDLSSDRNDREDRRAGGCLLRARTRGEWKSPELAAVAGASLQVGDHVTLT